MGMSATKLRQAPAGHSEPPVATATAPRSTATDTLRIIYGSGVPAQVPAQTDPTAGRARRPRVAMVGRAPASSRASLLLFDDYFLHHPAQLFVASTAKFRPGHVDCAWRGAIIIEANSVAVHVAGWLDLTAPTSIRVIAVTFSVRNGASCGGATAAECRRADCIKRSSQRRHSGWVSR